MTKSALIVHPNYNLYQKNNTAFCSSRQIAQEFSKNHFIVLRDIRELNCSMDFRKSNFVCTSQTVDIDYQERKYALAVKALPEKLS